MRVVQYLDANKSDEAYKDYKVWFPHPMGNQDSSLDKLFIIATIELQNTDTEDRFSVNVANITNSGFTARVTRLDGEGWGMRLQLNYMVSTCTIYS